MNGTIYLLTAPDGRRYVGMATDFARRMSQYSRGHGHGAVKDDVAKTHPNLVAWTALPEAEQRKDMLFLAIVRALSGRVTLTLGC